ncbi:hypothetical protein PIB30_082040 [Stylosanthes scabra]|uniref:Uncharacterized protein n=1 Tax=Stylosanthes scabra TaxID=79078 RepID=A0ABU6ZQJ0_9FABA|nr:hypothetical protein [Stylosanthes scabra]
MEKGLRIAPPQLKKKRKKCVRTPPTLQRWLAKGKVLLGNHPQELAVHLPAANLHKRLQDMRLLSKRRGVNWLLSGRYFMKGS